MGEDGLEAPATEARPLLTFTTTGAAERAGSDLRVMIYTAEPGTEDAERLALLTVLGTQDLLSQD